MAFNSLFWPYLEKPGVLSRLKESFKAPFSLIWTILLQEMEQLQYPKNAALRNKCLKKKSKDKKVCNEMQKNAEYRKRMECKMDIWKKKYEMLKQASKKPLN